MPQYGHAKFGLRGIVLAARGSPMLLGAGLLRVVQLKNISTERQEMFQSWVFEGWAFQG